MMLVHYDPYCGPGSKPLLEEEQFLFFTDHVREMHSWYHNWLQEGGDRHEPVVIVHWMDLRRLSNASEAV